MPSRLLLVLVGLLALLLPQPASESGPDDAERQVVYRVQVVDVEGNPIPGAAAYRTLTARPTHTSIPQPRKPGYVPFEAPAPAGWPGQPGVVPLQADKEGVLVIRAPRSKAVRVIVMPEGDWVPGVWTSPVFGHGRPEPRVVLTRGHRFEGRLRIGDTGVQGFVSASWTPAVYHWPSSGPLGSSWWIQDLPTAADGRFQFVVPRDVRLMLSASIPGRYRSQMVRIDTRTQRKLDLRVDAPKGAVVKGHIADMAGRPIAGARVWVGVDTDPMRRGWAHTGPAHTLVAMAVTNARGDYRVTGLPGGMVNTVAAEADGFLPSTLANATSPIPARGLRVIDVALAREAWVQGRVLDQGGKPVVGALVEVSSTPTGRVVTPFHSLNEQVVTDDKGAYRARAAPGFLVRASARAMAYDWDRSLNPARVGRRHNDASVGLNLDAEATKSKLPDLVLRKGVRLEGVVTTPDGRPVPFATVTAARLATLPPLEGSGQSASAHVIFSSKFVLTDAAGRFVFPGLPDDTRFRLSLPQSPVGSTAVPVEIRGGIEPERVRLVALGRTSVSGRVVDAAGAPVPYPQIGCQPRPAGSQIWSDASGRFRLTGIPAGKVVVSVSRIDLPESRAELEIDPSEPVDGLVFRIPGGGTLTGTVQDAEGNPVAQHHVRILHARIGSRGQAYLASDESGRFAVRGLPPGTYTISSERSKKVVDYTGEPLDVTLTVGRRRYTAFEGTVLDAAGQPIPRATVTTRTPNGNRRGGPVVGGRFHLAFWDQIVPESIEVVVHTPTDAGGRRLALAPFQAKDVAIDDADFVARLTSETALVGHLREPDGTPLADVPVGLFLKERTWWQDNQLIQTRTDANGRFEFGAPRRGKANVRVLLDERLVSQPDVEVDAEQYTIEMEGIRGRTLDVVLEGEDGKPIPRAQVTLFVANEDKQEGKAPRYLRRQTDDRGHVTFTRIDPRYVWSLSTGEARVRDLRFEGRTVRLATWPEKYRLTLRPYAFIRGRFVLAQRHTRHAFRITAEPWFLDAGLPRRRAHVKPGETAFAIENVPAGRYRLQVTAGPDFLNPEPIIVDAPIGDVEIRLTPAHPVRGRIVGKFGSGARVYLDVVEDEGQAFHYNTRTDAAGRFVLTHTGHRRGTLRVIAPGGQGAILPDVDLAKGPFEMTPGPLTSLDGEIRGYPAKTLSQGVRIHLVCGAYRAQTRTDSAGRFSFRGLLPGAPYRIVIPDAERLAGTITVPESVDADARKVVLRYEPPDPDER